MDSASFQFVLFGLSVAILSNLNRSRVWRLSILLVASIAFIALLAHTATSLLPLAGFLLSGYLGVLILQRRRSIHSAWIILAIIFAYIWLKQYVFLPDSIFLRFPYFTLGLSYIFFRVLHLVIESGQGVHTRAIRLHEYLLYTLNFTTFVSGPIQRYEDFARDQFANEAIPLDLQVIGSQLERIIRGFFKVNVLAMFLDALRQNAEAQLSQSWPPSVKMVFALRLAVVYPLFLYANFSGYIDIVVGVARLMRVRLPENFDHPFSASSFIEFWNRWHITLSTWLKTYVYNPLLIALMRHTSSQVLQPFLAVFCFFVTFFLVGIWHGRTSEFVFFGILQGGGVAINKLWQLRLADWLGRKGYKALASYPVYVAFSRGLTFSWFAFTLFWFWANWNQIDRIVSAIGVFRWLSVWLAVWLCATVSLAVWERLRTGLFSIKTSSGPVLRSRYVRVAYASGLALVAFVITMLINQPAPGIVYKAF